MNLVNTPPPNFAKIRAAFPNIEPGVFFCYGKTIHQPGVAMPTITASLRAHEQVHSVRQGKIGGPEIWWDRYIADQAFRFFEEYLAHKTEFAVACRAARGREERAHILSELAKRLSGPLYGQMTTFEGAKDLLLGRGTLPT